MNAAIAIGTLLLGGWVLDTPVTDVQPEATDQAPVAEQAAPDNASSQHRTQKSQDIQRTMPREEVQERLRNQREPQAQAAAAAERGDRTSSQPRGQTPTQLTGPKRAVGMMPTAPTEPFRPGTPGTSMMPVPPTAGEEYFQPSVPQVAADPFANPSGPAMPEIPTSRQASPIRPATHSSYYSETDESRQRTLAAVHPSYIPQAPPTKVFADSRPYSSGVSPYMGLFRNDTNGGTIDNYSTLVRPALDQRSMNQQFNLDIYGLERNARLQAAALRQVDRSNMRTPQGVGTPQFYLNYGNYYPDYGQGNYGQPGSGGYGQPNNGQ